jgi:hypothetical protein
LSKEELSILKTSGLEDSLLETPIKNNKYLRTTPSARINTRITTYAENDGVSSPN